MKLELGSGDRPTPGWHHLDIRPDAPGVDTVGDAANPPFEAGSCEAVRATHLLEHFSWRDTQTILARWRRLLAPGGELYVEVPSLEGHVQAWRTGQSTDERFVEYLFGEQDHEFNYHKTMFTATSLLRALRAVGFTEVHPHDFGLVWGATAT